MATNYFDPAFGGINFDSLTRTFEPQIAGARSDSAFLSIAQEMLRSLRTSHLFLSPPATNTTAHFGIGLHIVNVGNERVVVAIERGLAPQRVGIRAGDVIESGLDDLLGPLGTTARIHVKACDGVVRTMEVIRQPAWPPERPSVRWRQITEAPDRRIGFLHIVRFDDDAAPLIDSAMTELAQTDGLVIDIRENGGGNLSYLRLVAYVADEPGLAVALLARSFLNQWGRAPLQLDSSTVASLPRVSGVYSTAEIINAFRENDGGAAFYLEDLRSRGYRKPVIILTSARTGSAAEGFAAIMKGRARVMLVGQPTAGALIGAETFALPLRWRVTLPTHAGYGADGRLYHDTQILPDINVPISRADLCDGRDAVLERAFALLADPRPW